MKRFFWRLLGRCFWIKLRSHFKKVEEQPKKGKKYAAYREVEYYTEWEQRKNKTRAHKEYRLVCENPEGE